MECVNAGQAWDSAAQGQVVSTVARLVTEDEWKEAPAILAHLAGDRGHL